MQVSERESKCNDEISEVIQNTQYMGADVNYSARNLSMLLKLVPI